MVLLDSFRITRVLKYSGTYLYSFGISITGLLPSTVYLSRQFIYTYSILYDKPYNPTSRWFRLFPVRSPLLRESLLISSPSGTEMFHFPEFASMMIFITSLILELLLVGYPIQVSTIHKLLHFYSWLIAVYHAFLRLPMPRHPPVALTFLSSLIFSIQLSISLSHNRNIS